jgi:hypothetical protein
MRGKIKCWKNPTIIVKSISQHTLQKHKNFALSLEQNSGNNEAIFRHQMTYFPFKINEKTLFKNSFFSQ